MIVLPLWAGQAPDKPDDGRKYYYEDVFQPFFKEGSERPGYYFTQRPGADPDSFRLQRSSETFRVFIVGGSIAHEAMSHPRDLEEALAKALPGRRVEVLGCGMPGYDSSRELLVVREVVAYKPDLIVLMSGHNEGLGEGALPALGRLAGGLRGGKERAFEENLRAMFRAAAARGVLVAALLPPLNYRDAPPSGVLPTANPAFLRGWARYLGRQWEQARHLWQSAAGGEGSSPSGWNSAAVEFLLGRCAEALGRHQEALERYARSIDLDSTETRCSKACRQTISRVAVEEGGLAVDVHGAFLRAAPGGIPGLDLFDDKVHWRPRFNGLVSLEIVEALRRWPSFGGLSWDEKALRFMRRRWAVGPGKNSDEDLERTAAYALREAAPWGSPAQLNLRAVVFLESIQAQRPSWFKAPRILWNRAVRPQRRGYGPVMEEQPAAARFYWHAAEMLTGRGLCSSAKAFFAEALRLEPSLARVRLGLAAALAFSGEAPAARRAIAQAVADSRGQAFLAVSEAEGRLLEQALGLAPPPSGRP